MCKRKLRETQIAFTLAGRFLKVIQTMQGALPTHSLFSSPRHSEVSWGGTEFRSRGSYRLIELTVASLDFGIYNHGINYAIDASATSYTNYLQMHDKAVVAYFTSSVRRVFRAAWILNAAHN